MKKIYFLLTVFISYQAMAQVPEDALRYSWYPQNGSARMLAIGGAMGSLGGDISATFVNPAGLGFFKTSEFAFSPIINLNRNKSLYRGTETKSDKNNFMLSPTGFIFGTGKGRGSKYSSAFSLAVTQKASFNNDVQFGALNNFSSFSEQFAEEFAKSGLSINQVLNTNSQLPYTAAPALNTFLIDTATINGGIQVRGASENILDAGQALRQDYNKSSSGGIYELALGAAINDDEHWLFGASLGVPIVSYKSSTTLTEKDTSSNAMNGFSSATYTDNFKTTGAGINLKVGAIYRPVEYVRLGLSVETPSYMLLSDERTTSISTNLETPTGGTESFTESSRTYTNNQPGQSDYSQTSPWRAIASASYVFREIENVKKQKGFITADVEYVNHKGTKFGSGNAEDVTPDLQNYYKGLNSVVKDQYKGTFNFRAGGELKFNTIMTRLGVAYYGNPYADDQIKANMLLLSGGLGYRNKGFFADLTYVHNMTKDAIFPYRLQDRANTFANVDNTKGTIAATIGLKF